MTQPKKLRVRRRRNRSAISEVIATIVLVAITVVIGSVAWVWANSNALSSENSYFNVTAEKFEIVASTFSGGTAPWSAITLYVFNSGQKNTIAAAILITYGTCTISVTGSAPQWTLSAGTLNSLQSISLTGVSGSLSGATYTSSGHCSSGVAKGTIVSVVVTGQYGTNYDYQVTG